ncbi:hypothetical protein B0H11DRAFT_2200547 [Mycena galericulata]|nr:hypothetical protein B0H11DRAFT_2200547 [Mycena galericulata]
MKERGRGGAVEREGEAGGRGTRGRGGEQRECIEDERQRMGWERRKDITTTETGHGRRGRKSDETWREGEGGRRGRGMGWKEGENKKDWEGCHERRKDRTTTETGRTWARGRKEERRDTKTVGRGVKDNVEGKQGRWEGGRRENEKEWNGGRRGGRTERQQKRDTGGVGGRATRHGGMGWEGGGKGAKKGGRIERRKKQDTGAWKEERQGEGKGKDGRRQGGMGWERRKEEGQNDDRNRTREAWKEER